MIAVEGGLVGNLGDLGGDGDGRGWKGEEGGGRGEGVRHRKRGGRTAQAGRLLWS